MANLFFRPAGSCRVKLREGTVRSDGDFALTPRERESGFILTCCSYPTSESICIEL
ncbi:2Fe-2S iron-sulfur cluster-binding protein [Pseudomonas prosekii]|uniref:2Fe-2S iron-sulfur cluster-binding protein n=1 Tax=Pseudomonas prosekii TaxID=1148509 RepID=UPI0028167798|nr:2Fe-2S iron-sulfur cluster binding domain-containing protein [Pseudomonas prosekii]